MLSRPPEPAVAVTVKLAMLFTCCVGTDAAVELLVQQLVPNVFHPDGQALL